MRLRSHLAALIGFTVIGSALLPFFTGCSRAPDLWREAKAGQKRILVSFPPLYALTAPIAESDAYVLCMLTTQGPHDYDGGPNDLFLIEGADLLIYNGLSLDDSFVTKMTRVSKNKKLQEFNIGKALKERGLVLKGKDLPGHEGHGHGAYDPHVWLGPIQAIEMARLIADKLGEIDPDNKKKYQTRCDALIAKLSALHADGKKALATKTNRKLITVHESLGYFEHKKYGFDLDVVDVIQVKPGLDPDNATLARIIETCRKQDVPMIAVEPQYSAAQAEALQKALKNKGTDIKIATIDPLETAAPVAGTPNPDPDYYFKKMRENIETLAKTLP